MKRLMKRLTELHLGRTGLILAEILLAVMTVGASWLYHSWDRYFGKDEWTLTQYGPRDMNSQFYTLYNPRKGLIVIDGGWTEDADYVRAQIRKLGNRVDTWIITHPHMDHAGAFNVIWQDKKGMKIDRILTAQMPSPEECVAVAPWDNMDTYEQFLSLDLDNVHYVKAGETYDLLGLEMKVFSSFDENVRELSRDYLNDGSVMFRVQGPRKSILFCADVGKSMSTFLRKKWKTQLRSSYVQMGHHGYGGLKPKFYRKVKASVALFDAPDWLMYDETGQYDTPEKAALMEELGCEILSFNTAPNSLPL